MTISLSNATVLAGGSHAQHSTAVAGYELHSDGTIWKNVNGTSTKIGNWDTVANEGSLYECEFLHASGLSPTFNSAPSYTSLSTSQSVSLTEGVGIFTSGVTVNLRQIANHSVSATCAVTLEDILSN